MKPQNEHWRKKSYQKVTLETKLLVVDQILNGQISTNFASKKYDVPRTTITYWLRKYSTLLQQNTGMSKLAENNDITISMTEQYDPYENAVAERINRTLKYEYGLKQTIKNTELAQKMTQKAVYIYNNLRTHFSLDLRKPAEVHLNPNIKYKSYRKNNVNLTELTI